MVKRQRMDNIDLLRCISMIFIVSCHYFGNISKVADFELNTFSDISFKLISCIDNVGVNIFVLISGYFLVDSKFKTNKLLSIWIQVLTYSVVIYLLCYLVESLFHWVSLPLLCFLFIAVI